MSNNKGKDPNTSKFEEIDDFAQALLDKKTEMQLYDDEFVSEEQLSRTQQLYREKSRSQALNLLRSQRNNAGNLEDTLEYEVTQKLDVIEEKKPQKDEVISVEEETVPTIQKRSQSSSKSADSKNKEEQKQKTPVKKSSKKPAGKSGNKTKTASKKTGGGSRKPAAKKRKKRNAKKKRFILIAVLAALITLGLLAGYAYKVLVWDEQNIVSQEQENAYNKLVAYADEYDMMSETERMELLDLSKYYDMLLAKQKEKINDYFVEQTGKNYPDLIKELKSLKSNNDENSPNYTSLVNFFNQWNEMDAEGKAAIVDYKEAYQSLTKTLKNKIDALILEVSGSSFNSLYSEYTTIVQEEPKEEENEGESAPDTQQPAENEQPEQDDNSAQIAEWQAQRSSLQVQLSEYQQYGNSLQQELEAAQNNGWDTSAYQTYIDQNNQVISSLNSQIEALNSQLAQYGY